MDVHIDIFSDVSDGFEFVIVCSVLTLSAPFVLRIHFLYVADATLCLHGLELYWVENALSMLTNTLTKDELFVFVSHAGTRLLFLHLILALLIFKPRTILLHAHLL